MTLNYFTKLTKPTCDVVRVEKLFNLFNFIAVMKIKKNVSPGYCLPAATSLIVKKKTTL